MEISEGYAEETVLGQWLSVVDNHCTKNLLNNKSKSIVMRVNEKETLEWDFLQDTAKLVLGWSSISSSVSIPGI